MLNLFCTKSKLLKKKNIRDLLSLKNAHWKYSIRSQKKFFLENIKANDLHVLLYLGKTLIGYVCLRKNKFFTKKNYEKKNYLLFDTCIISKKFRGKNYTKILMNFTNKIIENYKYISILYCEKKLVNFYKKYHWKIPKKKIYNIVQPKKKKVIMSYNKNS